MFNGSILAAQQRVVVVTVNYRGGLFGFMPVTLPDGSVSANLGFQDQQLALRWVQSYIGAFGGDANQVTIFGESGGGHSVGAQLVSPLGKGLFHAAIMMSPYVDATYTLAYAQQGTTRVATQLGCMANGAVNVTCLEELPMTTLAALPVDATTLGCIGSCNMVVDGVVIPDTPINMVNANNYNKVPVIIGNTLQDAVLTGTWSSASVKCTVRQSVSTSFVTDGQSTMTAAKAEKILDLYPVVDDAANLVPNANRDTFLAISTDLTHGCGVYKLAKALAAQNNPVWAYTWARRTRCPGLIATSSMPGPYHASEVPYFFGTYAQVNAAINTLSSAQRVALGGHADACTLPDADTELVSVTTGLLGSFARTGVPSEAWAQFTTSSPIRLSLDIGVSSKYMPTSHYTNYKCSQLEAMGLTKNDNDAMTLSATGCNGGVLPARL